MNKELLDSLKTLWDKRIKNTKEYQNQELEEAKIKFKQIFDREADEFGLNNTRLINLVIEYAKTGHDLEKCLKLVEIHLKIQKRYYLDDDQIKEMIRNILCGG